MLHTVWEDGLTYLHSHGYSYKEHAETRDTNEDFFPVTNSQVVGPEVHHSRDKPLNTHKLLKYKNI